jgi:hypothetical protein
MIFSRMRNALCQTALSVTFAVERSGAGPCLRVEQQEGDEEKEERPPRTAHG